MAPEKDRPSGLRNIALILLVVFGVLGGGWLLFTRLTAAPGASPQTAKEIAASPAGKAIQQALMPEEERRAYVEKNVRVEGLEIAGDTKPADDGGVARVGGLLKVTGRVINGGDRAVTPVHINLTTLGETNEVLGSYVEDLTAGRPLEAGATREFKFEIPEKKGFTGRNVYKLR